MIDWSQKRIHQTLCVDLKKNVEFLYENPTQQLNTIILLCHPHPLFEGSMYNKVLTTLAKAAHQAGIASLRFNFSSIGLTTGPYVDFIHEVALLNQMISIVEDGPFQTKYLGGFSFGGAAVLLAKNPQWSRILIAPAWHLIPASTIFSNFSNILLVQTIDDTVVSPADSWTHFQKLNAQEKKLFVYGSGGHFFQDQLECLKRDLSIYYQQLL
ncbi:hypothetical protein EBR43_08350 [bacterium]|jgi:hypothetical protein|nr:hypothetical protein [bacterium]NBX72281.1 hypothetical protein [bacterium]